MDKKIPGGLRDIFMEDHKAARGAGYLAVVLLIFISTMWEALFTPASPLVGKFVQSQFVDLVTIRMGKL